VLQADIKIKRDPLIVRIVVQGHLIPCRVKSNVPLALLVPTPMSLNPRDVWTVTLAPLRSPQDRPFVTCVNLGKHKLPSSKHNVVIVREGNI
jgi:hypothetical protein